MAVNILSVDLPEYPEAVVFVNGIIARNLPGLFYMWRSIGTFQTSLKQAEGCMDLKAGITSPNELVLVSYWQSNDALKTYFKSKVHRDMMKYFYQHLDNLELYNETYHPTYSGKYNAAHGMAKVYPFKTT